jgi:hypothetical protein
VTMTPAIKLYRHAYDHRTWISSSLGNSSVL